MIEAAHIALAFALLSTAQPKAVATVLQHVKVTGGPVLGCWEAGDWHNGKWWSGKTICFDNAGNVATEIHFGDEAEIIGASGKYKLAGNKAHFQSESGNDGWLALFSGPNVQCFLTVSAPDKLVLSGCKDSSQKLVLTKTPEGKSPGFISMPKNLVPVPPNVISKS